MKKISLNMGIYKKVLPVFLVGVFAMVIGIVWLAMPKQLPPIFFVVLLLPIVFIYFLFKHLVFDLADEAFDCGTSLLIRKNGQEAVIPFQNIMNVSLTVAINPPRATLMLRQPCIFGSEVAFAPLKPLSLNPFKKNLVMEDLIVRIDAARRQSRAT